MGTFEFRDKKLAVLIFGQWEKKLRDELAKRKVPERLSESGEGLTELETTIFMLGSLQMIRTLRESVS